MGAQSGLNEFYDGGMLSVFMFFVAPGFWKRFRNGFVYRAVVTLAGQMDAGFFWCVVVRFSLF